MTIRNPTPPESFSVARKSTLDIEKYLAEEKSRIDQSLEALLPAESVEPEVIHRAMRHSVFAGGKRIRPILVIASGESLGGRSEVLRQLGSAIEMIHTYSLIHDDLPALDNDDLRRGRPTCHKAFGEDMAILAGDALLTRAFQVLSDLPGVGEANRLKILGEVSYAIGTINGMIGGQVVDLESEGKPVNARTVEYIHRSKTGALLASCTRCGALAADADGDRLQALSDYGQSIGLAFQIIDDILDVTATSEELGKTAGKDAQVKKATYPSIYGLEVSREKARLLIQRARESLAQLGESAERLRALARFILDRSA